MKKQPHDEAPVDAESSVEAIDSPGIPDRSVWRSEVATWDIPSRQRWADLAESYQADGDPWNVAEWKAFREVTA